MKKIFLPIVTVLVIFSCKKNTTPTPEGPCKPTPTIIAGTYKKTAIKYKESSAAAEQDLFTFVPDCEKDDTYQLKPDSSVIVSEGAETCPGPPPPGVITVWYLSNNNTGFSMDAVYDIVSFDCKNLVVVEKNFRVDGDTRTVTFTKQ
jgi:hypothetical protein